MLKLVLIKMTKACIFRIFYHTVKIWYMIWVSLISIWKSLVFEPYTCKTLSSLETYLPSTNFQILALTATAFRVKRAEYERNSLCFLQVLTHLVRPDILNINHLDSSECCEGILQQSVFDCKRLIPESKSGVQNVLLIMTAMCQKIERMVVFIVLHCHPELFLLKGDWTLCACD